MSSHLNHIQNWPERAKLAEWSTLALAKQCSVSTRTLERHFREQMHKPPKLWLKEQRHLFARDLLRNGRTVKEVAAQTGYKHASNFSREFKKHFGHCPATYCASLKRVKLVEAV